MKILRRVIIMLFTLSIVLMCVACNNVKKVEPRDFEIRYDDIATIKNEIDGKHAGNKQLNLIDMQKRMNFTAAFLDIIQAPKTTGSEYIPGYRSLPVGVLNAHKKEVASF